MHFSVEFEGFGAVLVLIRLETSLREESFTEHQLLLAYFMFIIIYGSHVELF